MALIGKIRKRSGLLLIFIGGAMVAFILSDLFGNRTGVVSNEVGEIYGEGIDGVEFNNRVETIVQRNISSGQQADEELIRDQVWAELLKERIMGRELAALGINVTADELFDLVQGTNIHPSIQSTPAFQNPQTGQFDRNNVISYMKDYLPNNPQDQAQWVDFERFLEQDRAYVKYNNMIKKGLYVTNSQAKRDHIAQNEKVNFKFVVKKYASVPDSTVALSEEEISAYYDKHKNDKDYEQEASRSFEYVLFPFEPSTDDQLDTRDWVGGMIEDFKNASNDSTFVQRNADTKGLGNLPYTAGSLPAEIDTVILQADSGTVVGPYLEGNSYKIAKITDIQMLPDSVNARHILIKPGPTETIEQALARGDSIKTVIQANNNFAELAQQLSEDAGSGVNGGDLGWFVPGAMVVPFNDACFEGETGDMPVVASQFGVHIIEIMDQSEKSRTIKMAVVDRLIRPSKETIDSVYNVASEFSINNNNSDLFIAAADSNEYRRYPGANVKEDDKFIPGLAEPRSLIRWAYGANIGDVSSPEEIGESFVVAYLKSIKDEGVPTLEDVRERVEREAMQEKKADIYLEKMAGGTTLEEVAGRVEETVLSASDIAFSSFTIPGGGGNEPAVIGKIFSLDEGQIGKVSVPIKGEVGVYVVMLESKTNAPEATDLTANKESILSRVRSRVDFSVYKALEDMADVKDDRSKFF